MKCNTGKCHFITGTNKNHQISVGNSSTESSSCKKLLGVKIDSKLIFDELVKSIFKKKANEKLITKNF